MVRSKTIHEVFAITAGAVFMLAASEAAIAQPLVWTDPVPLNNNAATDSGHDPDARLTTDGSGNWVVVWNSYDSLDGTIGTDLDALVALSADNGLTWTDPRPLNNNAATDLGYDGAPQVATDGAGNWVAVWSSSEDLGGTIGTDFDILVARSTDNGVTWTDPEPLNNNAATDSGYDANQQLTTDGAGNWMVVWHSFDDLEGTIGADSDVLVARSTDNGATWTDSEPLNNNAATDSGDDNAPKLTTDRTGNWVVVWESADNLGGTIGTDTDILVALSADNGLTWTDPAPLNINAATDSGSDYEPMVTTDAGGNWVTVWDSTDSLGLGLGTDWDILVARSTDNGLTWTYPEPLNNNAATDSGDEDHPELTTDGSGSWLTVWYSNDTLGGTIGIDHDALVALSSDNGLTWTDPEPLNNNAPTDTGDDVRPQLATDGAGNWVAVWDSFNDLGGTIGTDTDLLVARAQFGGSAIPTVSEWGLVAMSLLVLTAGTLVYARRRPIHA